MTEFINRLKEYGMFAIQHTTFSLNPVLKHFMYYANKKRLGLLRMLDRKQTLRMDFATGVEVPNTGTVPLMGRIYLYCKNDRTTKVHIQFNGLGMYNELTEDMLENVKKFNKLTDDVKFYFKKMPYGEDESMPEYYYLLVEYRLDVGGLKVYKANEELLLGCAKIGEAAKAVYGDAMEMIRRYG